MQQSANIRRIRNAVAVTFLSLAGNNTQCQGSGSGDTLTWSPSPMEQTIAPGAAATVTITIETKFNINSQVAFSASNLPTGWTASFNPPLLPDTGTTSVLTVQTPADVEFGVYRFDATADEVGVGQISHEITINVNRDTGQPDFVLEIDPSDHDFTSDFGGKSFSFRVDPLNGFADVVNLSLSELPAPLTLAAPLTPPTLELDNDSKGGTFVIDADNTHTPFDAVLTLTATSGSISHTRTARLHRGAVTPTGACCTSGVCSVKTEASCRAGDGNYQGDGAGCSAGACASGTQGACCFGSSCLVATQSVCQTEEGTFKGVGTSCSPSPCP